jgi:dipeptidase E
MKLLLTSAGFRNPTIERALVELVGKPVAEIDAMYIPTAIYGHPYAGPRQAWRNVSGEEKRAPLAHVGWKSVAVLELTALPTLPEDTWLPLVRNADVILADGGDAVYLAHHMRESGLADLLPSLDAVWVGLSGGSLVMTPRIGDNFVHWRSPEGDRTLGFVDFSIFPHVDHPDLPTNTMAAAERWAADIGGPAYALDDESAIRVVDGAVDVVSEGNWRLFNA